jgi:hypothetical protein
VNLEASNVRIDHGLTVRRGEYPASYHYLQITLLDVDRRDVSALPHALSISRQLLRRNLICLPDAEYQYDCVVRNGDAAWRAGGVICVSLALRNDYPDMRGLDRKRDEVANSYERGLLDDIRRSRADFRLGSKPLLQKLTGLQEAEYLPDAEWQVDVVFAQWYDEDTHESALTPADISGDLSRLSVSLETSGRRRGFRMTDLF